MNRPVTIHVLLLAAALVAAYFVWTRDRTTREDEIPILSLRGGLDRVVYSAPKRVVELQRKKDDRGTYQWVKAETVTEKPAPKPKPAATPDAGPTPAAKQPASTPATDAGPPKDSKPAKPEMIKVTKRQEFKGNKSAEELVKGLSTLSAVRSLGKMGKDKLEAFGLAESNKTLTLIAGASHRTFIIGGNTYGNRDVYVQDRQDKRVYVVKPRLLQDLQYAEFRLVDRSLHGFQPADVQRATLVADKRRKVLIQKSRRDPANAYWVDAEAPETKKAFFRNFMSKLLRLQATEYVKPDEQKKPLTEILAVQYELASGKRGALRLSRAGPAIAPPAAGGKAPTGEYYAVSSNTRTLVKITPRMADELARDIESLMKE